MTRGERRYWRGAEDSLEIEPLAREAANISSFEFQYFYPHPPCHFRWIFSKHEFDFLLRCQFMLCLSEFQSDSALWNKNFALFTRVPIRLCSMKQEHTCYLRNYQGYRCTLVCRPLSLFLFSLYPFLILETSFDLTSPAQPNLDNFHNPILTLSTRARFLRHGFQNRVLSKARGGRVRNASANHGNT